MTPSTPSSHKPKPSTNDSRAIGTSFEFEAIGTAWQIELFDDVSQLDIKSIKTAVLQRIDEFDRNYSRFRTDSLVTTMSQKAGSYTLPTDAKPLLDIYQQLYRLTDSLMTPLIGRTLASAGYDATYSLKAGDILPAQSWDETLDYAYPQLSLKQPALLDFGAAGKGYLVDIVGELLKHHGIDNYCVNAGGDIRYHTNTKQPIQVGLEHPADSTQAIGIASLHNQSLCGSAGNRRAWAGFHHIINPATLQSPRHIEALWVSAKDTITADAVSTALFFVAPEILQTAFDFEYAIIQADYSLERSAAFPAEFFA